MLTISQLVAKYQGELIEKCKIPKASCKRSILGNDGQPNRSFFVYLCMDHDLTIKFLQEIGLLKSKMECDKCKIPMQLQPSPDSPDKMCWYCNKWEKVTEGDRTINVRCKSTKTVRDGSWFRACALTIPEMLLLTYELVYGAPLSAVRREYGVAGKVLAEWASFCREVYVYYVEVKARRIGGPGKLVEVGESDFGAGTEQRWVLGGIEPATGECFLVPIKDRRSDTLIRIITSWVLPGTTVVSDSCEACKGLEDVGYACQSANLNRKGSSCNTIEATWRYIKASMPPRSKDEMHFVGYLAAFMFHRHCQAVKRDVFVEFMEIIRLIYKM